MNWMKYKKIYFAVSGALILLGITSLFVWGLKLSVDFTGGTIIEYRFQDEISTKDVLGKIENDGFEIISIQNTGENKYLFKFPPMMSDEKEEITSLLKSVVGEGEPEELRFEIIGPSIGPELVKKTVYAIIIATASILLWVAYQFKSIKFGSAAILAMLHDSFILVGSFALLGHFFGAEVDFLFVTALLTTLSFSAHDTIVVFDRIREIGGKNIDDLEGVANRALTETMVRSLNNSFTIGFMLVALILLGGSTVKWFAIALFIGTVLGTYSSPFVAVPLLVSWDDVVGKINFLVRRRK